MKDRIKVKGGFITKNQHRDNIVFCVQTPWKDKYFDIMKKHNATTLRLTGLSGRSKSDYDFLATLPKWITGIQINSDYIRDTRMLGNLPWIKELYLSLAPKPIYPDFSRFANLEIAMLDSWTKEAETLRDTNSLKLFFCTSYPYEDLEPLNNWTNLRYLKLHRSRKLKSLTGIEKLKNLRAIEFYSLSQLTDISRFADCPILKIIDIESCKKIGCLPEFKIGNKLRFLAFDNCNEIESLEPIMNCQNLTNLFFGVTKILDGKIKIIDKLKNLQSVGLQNRKFYDYTREELHAWHLRIGSIPFNELFDQLVWD